MSYEPCVDFVRGARNSVLWEAHATRFCGRRTQLGFVRRVSALKTLRANGRRRPECCGRSGRVACGDCGGRRRGVDIGFRCFVSHSAELHSEERRFLRAMHQHNGVPAGDMLWTDVLDIVKLTVPMPLPFMAMSHGNRFHIPLKLISGPFFRQQVCDSAVEWSGRARLLSLFMKFRALNIRPTLVSALILNLDVGNFDYSAPYRSRSRSNICLAARARPATPNQSQTKKYIYIYI